MKGKEELVVDHFANVTYAMLLLKKQSFRVGEFNSQQTRYS